MDVENVVEGVVVDSDVEVSTPAPAPMLAGTFALYQLPDQGLMLVTDIPGRGEERRVVPGKLLRMMTTGPAGKLLGRLAGGEVT